MCICSDGSCFDIWEALCHYFSSSGNWHEVRISDLKFDALNFRNIVLVSCAFAAYQMVETSLLLHYPCNILVIFLQHSSLYQPKGTFLLRPFDYKLHGKLDNFHNFLFPYRDLGWKMWSTSKSICIWECFILWQPLVLLQ